MKPQVLCYNLDGAQTMAVRITAARCGVRVRTADPSEFGKPLEELLTQSPPETAAGAAPAFAEPMLVMAFFTQDLMNRFLAGIRQGPGAPVRLKAVLTPSNRGWDGVRLHDELSAEDRAMRGGKAPVHEAP